MSAPALPWPALPAALRGLSQWVNWRMELRNGRPTKVPLCPRTLRYAQSTNPATWGPFPGAWRSARAEGLGLGFVFAAGGGLVGVDLDDCITADGTLTALAETVVGALTTYTEITPSGRGLHCIGRGGLPGPRRRTTGIELYPDGRFFTMTGRRWPGTPATVQDCHSALAQLYADLFPEPVLRIADCGLRTAELSDADILRIVSAAANADKWRRLQRGDISGYASGSEADAALCSLLAFYTRDTAQVARLFALSGLADAKWHARPDYRARTLALAQGNCRARFGDRGAA